MHEDSGSYTSLKIQAHEPFLHDCDMRLSAHGWMEQATFCWQRRLVDKFLSSCRLVVQQPITHGLSTEEEDAQTHHQRIRDQDSGYGSRTASLSL
jgi:hypothetical protein